MPYRFLCGDLSLCAIYIPISVPIDGLVQNNCMSTMELYKCIKEGDIAAKHVTEALDKISQSAHRRLGGYFQSFFAIGAAGDIYAKLPGAQVNLQAMSLRVSKAKWWEAMLKPQSSKVHAVMACIAYFETGGLDVNPEDLGDYTFAVCHATSIFVASRLLGDPIDDTLEHSVERIIGNVGKPGLSFLVTPPDPKSQAFDPSSWHLIAHEKYDGKKQDSFWGTSFHLSFTGYELPLGVGQRSGRDIAAYLLETVISVYDKDKWVADLEILRASKRWKKAPVLPCSHPLETQNTIPELPLVSVDSWLEIIDPPQPGQNAVVRATGNPIARLATATMALQMRHKVLILPEKVCWACQGRFLVGLLDRKAFRISFSTHVTHEGELYTGELYTERGDGMIPSSAFDLSDAEAGSVYRSDSESVDSNGEILYEDEPRLFIIY
ncbi:hypothetical protein BGZ63DRAFT_397291 [Mariannaea sp. PMI_226]|nr:hypothetical protein BGZ63DRAFT_397291 [Mariannaea sp. PMI_226]